MFLKSTLIAALAALSIASPAPVPVAEPLTAVTSETVDLAPRQAGTSKDGVIFLYSGPNQTGSNLAIFSYDSSALFCQQFQPTRVGSVSFKSYIGTSIIFRLWPNANCAGTYTEINIKNLTSENVNYGPFLSFEAIYQSRS